MTRERCESSKTDQGRQSERGTRACQYRFIYLFLSQSTGTVDGVPETIFDQNFTFLWKILYFSLLKTHDGCYCWWHIQFVCGNQK